MFYIFIENKSIYYNIHNYFISIKIAYILTNIMVEEFSNNVETYKEASCVQSFILISFKPTKHTVDGI